MLPIISPLPLDTTALCPFPSPFDSIAARFRVRLYCQVTGADRLGSLFAQGIPAMPDEPIPLTPEGKDRLASELESLRDERKEVAERIQNARELGSSQADSEYDDAKTEQGRIEGRILEIEDILRRATIIDEAKTQGSTRVVLGSGVKVEQDGKARHYRIVGPPEADVLNGRIPSDSPVGSALLGRAVGDVVEVNAPRGITKIKIVEID